MKRLPIRIALPGSLGLVITLFFALGAGLVWASGRSIVFVQKIDPPSTKSFDISFVDNGRAEYVLADRTNIGVDLFNAKNATFTGTIGAGGFVGPGPMVCGQPHACAGPNGTLIDGANHVWAGDANASGCSTPACNCGDGLPYSHVKAYTIAPSTGTTGQLACVDTGGQYRADEMSWDPAGYLLVANDVDGFLSLIRTTGVIGIASKFYYADNDAGQPATVAGLSTEGGGIEQSVYDPNSGYFYQAIPGPSNSGGRIDVFNVARNGILTYVKSIDVPGCDGGPTGLALDETQEFLGACSATTGAALIEINGGAVSIIGSGPTTGGADEIWFDPGSNTWYLGISSPTPQLGVVTADPSHTVEDFSNQGGGHSVAAYTGGTRNRSDPHGQGTNLSLIYQPKGTSSVADGVNEWENTQP